MKFYFVMITLLLSLPSLGRESLRDLKIEKPASSPQVGPSTVSENRPKANANIDMIRIKSSRAER